MGPSKQWGWNVLSNKFLYLRLEFCRVLRLKLCKKPRFHGWARWSHRGGKGNVTMYSQKSHRKQGIPFLNTSFGHLTLCVSLFPFLNCHNLVVLLKMCEGEVSYILHNEFCILPYWKLKILENVEISRVWMSVENGKPLSKSI